VPPPAAQVAGHGGAAPSSAARDPLLRLSVNRSSVRR
jgi:hypothetical protein